MEELLKITKHKVDNHMHYGKWYYVGAIVLVLIIVSVAYTATTPRYPKENTVSIVMYAGMGDEEVMDSWEMEMLENLPEDQREVEIVTSTVIEGSTETVMIARIAAGDDDVLIAEIETIEGYASQGAFLALDELVDFDKLSASYPSVDWSEYLCEAVDEKEDIEHIYYLPLGMIEGFDDIGFPGEGLGISVLANSVNADNAITCIEYLLEK